MQERHETTGPESRGLLRGRIDDLIERLRAGEAAAVRDSIFDRRWRAGLDVRRVDSGQIAFADNLVDEAHTILRRRPDNVAAAIERLERARGKITA